MPNKSIDYVTVASLIKMKCANGNPCPHTHLLRILCIYMFIRIYIGEPHFVMIKQAHESWCANKQPSCVWKKKKRKLGRKTHSQPCVWKAFSVGHVYISVREILIIPFWTAQGKDKLFGIPGFIFSHSKASVANVGRWKLVVGRGESRRKQGAAHLEHMKTIKIYAWLTRKQQNVAAITHTHSHNTHTHIHSRSVRGKRTCKCWQTMKCGQPSSANEVIPPADMWQDLGRSSLNRRVEHKSLHQRILARSVDALGTSYGKYATCSPANSSQHFKWFCLYVESIYFHLIKWLYCIFLVD